VKEGWYDGGSIAFAVFLVIIVTGTEFDLITVSLLKCARRPGINLASRWVYVLVDGSASVSVAVQGRGERGTLRSVL
jgi:hypothetical protein